MMKRLASVAAASLLAGAALFGSSSTAAYAGNSWDARSNVPDAGNSWDVRADTPRLGDHVQPTNGNSWD